VVGANCKEIFAYTRVIRPESKGEVARTIEEGYVTTRRIVVVEFDTAVAHSFVVARVASSGEDGEVVAVEVDLGGWVPVSTCFRRNRAEEQSVDVDEDLQDEQQERESLANVADRDSR